MRAELRDSLDNLYADDRVGRRPVCRRVVDVARGGIAAVHVLIDGLSEGDLLHLAVKRQGRLVRGAKWFRLHSVPVEENTGLIGFTVGTKVMREPPLPVEPNAPNPWVARQAPFRTFDAMEPIGSRVRADVPVTALRLHLPIGRDDRPGLRGYAIEVRHGTSAVTLSLDVNVDKPLLPRIGGNTVCYTNWFDYEGIARRHGVKLWSEAYWSMLRQYATLMAHARQNTFWIPLSLIFCRTRHGLMLNRPRLRRIVKTFTDAGLYFIEGGHVAHRRAFTDAKYILFLTEAPATSVQGHADLSVVCAQLRDEIERQGWRDRWIQHVADEPTSFNAADYRILTGLVRKHLPGLPLMDALEDPTMAGAVDIWCPKVQEYQRQRKTYEAYRATGDRVWCYTCCFPGGPWLNRLLDQELLRPALLGWGMALFQLDGYLHWGLNHYGPHQDPLKQSVLPRKEWENKATGTIPDSLPAGDTHIVYPGPEGPWSSLRLEAQREGCEDFELLQKLRAKNPAQAAGILRKVITGFDRYIKDVRQFRTARRMLYRV